MSIGVRASRKQLLEEQQNQQDYLKMAWSIFKRKWWLVIIVLSISVVFAYYYSKVPEGPYMATALVRPVLGSGGSFSIPFGGYLGGGVGYTSMETEFEIIKGKRVIEKVIDKLNLTELYRKPLQKSKKQKKTNVESRSQDLPPELKKRFLISEIQGRLDVGWQSTTTTRKLNLIAINVRSYSPKEAMEIANATAEAYIEVFDSYKQTAWQNMLDLLEIELKKSQVAMEKSRNQLYETANEKELASAFSNILSGANYAPSDIPVGVSSLRARIMELEIQLEVLRKDYSELDVQVVSLKKQLEELRQRLAEEETKAKEKFSEQYGMSKVSAQAIFDQQLYQTLAASHQQLKAQYLMEKQSPEIIERAEMPFSPTTPSRRSGLSLAVAAGITLGIILSLFLEYLDTTMRSPGDVARQIGIPIIGTIPRLKGMKNKPGSDALITYKGENSSRKSWLRKHYKESYRILQFGAIAAINEEDDIAKNSYLLPNGSKEVDNSSSNHRGIAIMVASCAPDEGKSTTAANLAISIAQTERKVLLIDSDIRQPKQHTLFGMGSDGIPKLSDVLMEKATMEEACRKSSVDNLYIMVSGNEDEWLDNTAILSSPKMQELVNLLRNEFNVIILDSPAASIASESAAMGSMVDGVIIVIKTASTKKNALLQAKETIQYSGGNILGAALNFAPSKKKNHKYY